MPIRLMNIPVYIFIGRSLARRKRSAHWDPPMLIVGKLAAIAALVALNAFFVACEFSVVKVRTTQLDALLEEGNVRAHFVSMSAGIWMRTFLRRNLVSRLRAWRWAGSASNRWHRSSGRPSLSSTSTRRR